jgi:NDP-sugar pyrophosphorylase family protein
VVTVAVLLAAGLSRRLGREKPLLELDGETLIARHARQLSAIGVRDLVVVCHAGNEAALRDSLAGCRAEFVRQRGEGMTAAVRTGLACVATNSLYLVCVNDLILDRDYARIEARGREGLVIPSRLLEQPFDGGRLELEGRRVLAIVEKPPGGCPPGSAANVMVHRWAGGDSLRALARLLDAGDEYETAVNHLIAGSMSAEVVWLDFWLAIKTPADLERALSKTSGAAPENA